MSMIGGLLLRLPQPWRFRVFFRIERFKAAVGRLIRRKATCGDCGHFFDPADERCFRSDHAFYRDPRYRGLGSICPACNQMKDGATAWAVHNDCNGVFTSMLHATKADADAQAKPLECGVVPVRVLIEPEDNWDRRDWDDRQ